MMRAREPGLLIICCLAASCGKDPGDPAGPAAAGPAWAYEKELNPTGPVRLVLRVDRTEASLADRIVLEQELRVEEGFEADFPEYLPEDFEGFAVVDIEREREPADPVAAAAVPPPAPGGPPAGRAVRARKKRLTLEPDRSGSLVIAPLAVYYHETSPSAETGKKEEHFLTEEIPIQIKGIEDVGGLTLAPARGIFEAPPAAAGRTGWWIAGGAMTAALAAVAAWLLLRRRRRETAAPAVPPHELALEALRRLVALNLLEKGQVEVFFVHLSGILRQYIENRFAVRAPERTTEEFLEEATRHEALREQRPRLGQFLSLSDQVKFARFRPDEGTIQGAFDVLKELIAETSPAASTT